MCLVKDQTKRPTAEKLLKHSFFKNAKPPELTIKSILSDLPPLWDRVKALQVCCLTFHVIIIKHPLLGNVAEVSIYFQLKDAAQLALKKMPSSEQEALSLVCDMQLTRFYICSLLFNRPRVHQFCFDNITCDIISCLQMCSAE